MKAIESSLKITAKKVVTAVNAIIKHALYSFYFN